MYPGQWSDPMLSRHTLSSRPLKTENNKEGRIVEEDICGLGPDESYGTGGPGNVCGHPFCQLVNDVSY